ncbi:hypothetical protein AMTRI_Chr12g236420 [Amborella trichopoda]|uniref:uncharacterized protein LOC110006621 n=1 Tax=Amborella trichopoda TaxID=13333 RepID=UPI0009C0AA44|nr:uncharacterized protein LOC110006621 [Amborella trichopoda]|eukprot:XP_020518387.1 uncharacterized protein LOC110006621 [Amborella trichopoda]
MDSRPWLSDEPGIKYAHINAFTHRPFGGNPAAVCYLSEIMSDKWMQLVAREFNLSETAFLMKIPDVPANNEFSLRWVNPKVECQVVAALVTTSTEHAIFVQEIFFLRVHMVCNVNLITYDFNLQSLACHVFLD